MSYFDTETTPYDPPKYTLWLVLEAEELKAHPYYQFTEKRFPENANAGFDLISVNSSFSKEFGHRHLYLSDLGVRAVMTRGDELRSEAAVHYRLVPRSSIYKTGYMMANSEGIIDRSYRGVLKAPVVFVGSAEEAEPAYMTAGNRYVQIVAPDLGWISCVRIVTSLPSTERGEGGFGSTGK
jgi:dUTPase